MNRDFRPAIRRALQRECTYDFLKLHMPAAVKPTKVRNFRKYPFLSRDARALGTSRQYLWNVLEGGFKSKSMLRRYQELRRKQSLRKQTFAERVRYALVERGESVAQLAKRVGYHKQYVSSVIRGSAKSPKVKLAIELALFPKEAA